MATATKVCILTQKYPGVSWNCSLRENIKKRKKLQFNQLI